MLVLWLADGCGDKAARRIVSFAHSRPLNGQPRKNVCGKGPRQQPKPRAGLGASLASHRLSQLLHLA